MKYVTFTLLFAGASFAHPQRSLIGNLLSSATGLVNFAEGVVDSPASLAGKYRNELYLIFEE